MAGKLIPWDPVDYLHTKEDVRCYLEVVVDENSGDGRLIRAALGHIARALDTNRIKYETGITGEELRKELSEDGGPSFAAVSRITRLLGMKLKAEPAEDCPEPAIQIRTIPKEEAQAEIIDLFASGETLCYDDISDRLRLDLELVVEICQELEDTGVIPLDGL